MEATADYSGNVCRDLELEQLANDIVDTPAPHNSLDDRSQVVVHEDDARSLLGDLGTSDARRKPYVVSLGAGPSFVQFPVTPTVSPSERRISPRTFLSSGGD